MKMKSTLFKSLIILMIGGLLFSACKTGASTSGGQATAIPPVVSNTEIVAEGKIAPRDSRDLSFFTTGQVQEILIKEGDTVKAGDMLARLGDREKFQAQIANAEADLLAAQRALN